MNLETISDILHRSIHDDALPSIDWASGLSGRKLMTILKLAAEEGLCEEPCYLEVGVFRGFTLLNVASHLIEAGDTMPKLFGIDNFSQFDAGNENESIVRRGLERLELDDVLINKDYEEALLQLEQHIGSQKVGVYFVDGPHDYRSQILCLQLVLPHLSKEAVIIIDDANYQHVRLATYDFLRTNPTFKLAFEAYTPCHPKNADAAGEKRSRDTWWNGVHVLVQDPLDRLENVLPEIGSAKSLSLNEHEHQAFRFAEIMHEGKALMRLGADLFSLAGLRDREKMKEGLRIMRRLRRYQDQNPKLFDAMNTYSLGLRNRLNPSLKAL